MGEERGRQSIWLCSFKLQESQQEQVQEIDMMRPENVTRCRWRRVRHVVCTFARENTQCARAMIRQS